VNDDYPSLPAPGLAEVRVTAATPDTARKIAQTLRRRFVCTEQLSCPAGPNGGTRLRLTVDTARSLRSTAAFRSGRTGVAAYRGRQDTKPEGGNRP
jgi:hypothetical protein